MNELLFHSAGAAARDLRAQLTALFEDLPAEKASSLLEMLNIAEEHDRPRMVFTGQYSSGKSTLINALTNEKAMARVDSAVATDRVERYDWDGLVDLVDTPGVQAGHDEHDEIAEAALLAADLILFTVTAELFDDRLVEHLRHVTSDLRKAPQLLVVLTKSRTRAVAEGVRSEAVRDALGAFAGQVPWVECDAQTYLQGLHEFDEARRSRRIDASNMAAVSAALNEIARTRGDLARFRVPLQQVALTASEALALLAPDPDEEAVLTVLARQRAALTSRRSLIDLALKAEAAAFRTRCIRAAEELAESVDALDDSPTPDWSLLDEASATVNKRLAVAHQGFVDGIGAVIESQLADLTSEVRQIESSPYARQLVEVDLDAPVDARTFAVTPDSAVRTPAPRSAAAWAPKFAKHLEGFQKAWGAGGSLKEAAGTPGHQIVYKAGKVFGKKFEPWQAVKWANNVGKVAKGASFILPVALEVHAVWSEERQEIRELKSKMRRRADLVGRVLAQSDEIAEGILSGVRREIDVEFQAALAQIDEIADDVRSTRPTRGDAESQLELIRDQAHARLTQLDMDSNVS